MVNYQRLTDRKSAGLWGSKILSNNQELQTRACFWKQPFVRKRRADHKELQGLGHGSVRYWRRLFPNRLFFCAHNICLSKNSALTIAAGVSKNLNVTPKLSHFEENMANLSSWSWSKEEFSNSKRISYLRKDWQTRWC